MRPWRGLLRALVLMTMWPARFVAPLSSPPRVSREDTAEPPTGAPVNRSDAGGGSADPELTDTFHGRDGKGQARTGQAAATTAAADLLENGPNAGHGARGAGEWEASHEDSFWDESQGRQRTQSPWESQVTGTRAGEDVEQWELKRGPKRGSFVGVEAWRRGTRSPQLQHSSSGSAHKSRDWCAYVQTRIATSVVTNGTETFGATVAEPCPWGQGSCQNRHTFKEMTRPLYRIKHSIVTSLQWKCCPGHMGPACDLTEEAVGTASLHEHPPPPQQRAHGRQSDDNDGDTIPGVTAQLLLGLKGKGDTGSVWSAPRWGGADGSEVDDDDYGKDMEGFEQRESRSVAHGHSATRVHSNERKVTLDSASEELVIDLVRKLLDERLGEASRRLGHGTGGLDVTMSTPSAAQLARDLQLLQHSLSSLNDSVSQRLDDLTWRVQNLEKATSRSSEERSALLLGQQAHRAAVETTTRRLAEEARTRAREAAEARGELASELRGDLGKMWKFAKDRLDTMNLTITGLQVNAAPAAAAAAEITSNAAASKPAPESSDGGDGGDDGRMKAHGSDAQKAKAVPTQDFSRLNETLKRHEYLLRDVYNQLYLFTEKLKELSYRIQEEQEASWGECNKLQHAFKASEDSLSIKLLEVQEQLLDMNKTIVIGLSPMEGRFGSVMSTIHNLSIEVGHLREILQRRAQDTDWLDEAQSLREQMAGLISSVHGFKIDVEDLKFSRSVLGSGVQLPSPASDLESQVNSTKSTARRALEQSGALGSNVSHLHQRVERLSALTLSFLAQASLMSQHVDDLNGSFNTLMEDTLRHTLALEELGAFRDSDYDDYDGEYADAGDGVGKPGARVEINLVKLSRLLSETVGAVREQSDVVLAMRSRLLALQLQVANSTSSAPRPGGGPREREETAVAFGGEFESREDEGEPEGRADRLWERLGRLERAWFELDGQRLGRLESRLNEMAGVAAGCLDRTDALREEVDRNASALQRTLAAMASSRDAEMEALRRDLLAELSAHVEAAMRARRKDKDERRQQRKETLSKQQQQEQQQRAGKGPAALHGAGSEPGHAEAARMPGFLEPAHLTEASQRGGRRLTRAKATHARTTWNIATAPRAGQEDGTKQRHNSP